MQHEPGLRRLSGLDLIHHHSLSDCVVGYGEAFRELFEQVPAMLTMTDYCSTWTGWNEGATRRAKQQQEDYRRE